MAFQRTYHFDMQFYSGGNSSAYRAEPMSGASGFGWYGYSQESGLNPPTKGCSDSGTGCTQSTCGNIHDPSPYWVSRSPLGRDATNDGCSDVFARETTGILRRYAGNCAGGLGNYQIVSSGWYSSPVLPIMGSTLLNSSANPANACADLMAREYTPPYRLRVYSGNCTGYYSPYSYSTQGSGWDPNLLDNLMTAGDMSGDGCADVFARETSPPYVMRLYFGNKSGGTCTGSLGSYTALGSGWTLNLLAAVGDVTGDGCFDLVGAEADTPNKLRVYAGDCAGGLTLFNVRGSGWHPSAIGPILGPGDFDGDGCGDLLAREMTDAQAMLFYPGYCNGIFADTATPLGSGWSPTALPDLIPR